MFYYLQGELAYRDINTCVIDCGGVGYKLTVSLLTSEAYASKLGKTVKLYTHLAVREDGIELFGFGSNEEKECFNRLTSVSGIGPKAAMSILSTMTPERLAVAICTEDKKAIAKAPGIGIKTAQRLILELKDKISIEETLVNKEVNGVRMSAELRSSNMDEALEALVALGYSSSEALKSIKNVENASEMDVELLLKAALKNMF